MLTNKSNSTSIREIVVIRLIRSSIFRNESSDRSIVSPFPFGRKETTRKLLHLPMIRDALTALSLPVTGFVGAGALRSVLFDMAFQHLLFSSLCRRNKKGSRGQENKGLLK